MGFFDWLFGSDDDDGYNHPVDVSHKKDKHSYCGHDYTTPDNDIPFGVDPWGICNGPWKD